jgi:hypothetical protein
MTRSRRADEYVGLTARHAGDTAPPPRTNEPYVVRDLTPTIRFNKDERERARKERLAADFENSQRAARERFNGLRASYGARIEKRSDGAVFITYHTPTRTVWPRVENQVRHGAEPTVVGGDLVTERVDSPRDADARAVGVDPWWTEYVNK